MKKIKFYDIIATIVYILLTSFVSFLTCNLIYSDISNFVSGSRLTMIATIPHLMFTLLLISLGFFFMRYRKLDEKYRSHFKKTYLLMFTIYSFIGFITSLLSGAIVYKNFLAPYPYSGAIIVCLVIHLIIFTFTLSAYIKNKLRSNINDEKYAYKTGYVFKTIFFALFAFISFVRLGCFMTFLFYTDFRHIAYVLTFYFSCLIPVALLIYICLNEIYKYSYFTNTVTYTIFLFIGIICMSIVVSEATTNPLLISLISPAMPLERLMTFPVEAILLYGIAILLPIYKITSLMINRFKTNKN